MLNFHILQEYFVLSLKQSKKFPLEIQQIRVINEK